MRFSVLVSAFLLVAGLFCISAARAAEVSTAPGADGVARYQIGSIEVFALLDMPGEMDISLFKGPATAEQRQALMPGGKAPSSVSAFLVKTGGKNVLVDSGWGDSKPGSRLPAGLKLIGVTPEDINLVLLTHMHRDHISGLLRAKGKAYPNAVVLAAEQEAAFWFSPEARAKAADNAKLAEDVRAAYGGKFAAPFAPAAKNIAPGVSAVNAFGHTPGHTAFLVESEGKRLVIIGDLIHAAALQFPMPDECASYDMNPAEAAAARKALLGKAAAENIPVAGMHLPFPPVGRVSANGKGGFIFTPGL